MEFRSYMPVPYDFNTHIITLEKNNWNWPKVQNCKMKSYVYSTTRNDKKPAQLKSVMPI